MEIKWKITKFFIISPFFRFSHFFIRKTHSLSLSHSLTLDPNIRQADAFQFCYFPWTAPLQNLKDALFINSEFSSEAILHFLEENEEKEWALMRGRRRSEHWFSIHKTIFFEPFFLISILQRVVKKVVNWSVERCKNSKKKEKKNYNNENGDRNQQ